MDRAASPPPSSTKKVRAAARLDERAAGTSAIHEYRRSGFRVDRAKPSAKLPSALLARVQIVLNRRRSLLGERHERNHIHSALPWVRRRMRLL